MLGRTQSDAAINNTGRQALYSLGCRLGLAEGATGMSVGWGAAPSRVTRAMQHRALHRVPPTTDCFSALAWLRLRLKEPALAGNRWLPSLPRSARGSLRPC